nr:MAG TPA: hypothetical protein [Caudoviricetes sp.]
MERNRGSKPPLFLPYVRVVTEVTYKFAFSVSLVKSKNRKLEVRK